MIPEEEIEEEEEQEKSEEIRCVECDKLYYPVKKYNTNMCYDCLRHWM